MKTTRWIFVFAFAIAGCASDAPLAPGGAGGSQGVSGGTDGVATTSGSGGQVGSGGSSTTATFATTSTTSATGAGAGGATSGAGGSAGSGGAGGAGFDGGNEGAAIDAHASDGATIDGATADGSTGGNQYRDDFNSFDSAVWSCEYSCPTASGGLAKFALLPGIAPNNNGSWSKARFKPTRFTSGKFTAKFALSKRPSQPVWWGIALWDDGPSPDGSQASEINFGITTSESATNSQMRFESMKAGKDTSLVVETGVDLYDGSFHIGQLVYDATRVELYFDGKLLSTITDTNVIPTAPMDYLLGTRLVQTPALGAEFDEIVDSTLIEW
jgi:hypothetical protein